MDINMSNATVNEQMASIGAYRGSFSGLPDGAVKLDFLNNYTLPGDYICVHPDTGVVSSEIKHTPEQMLNYWSEVVFKSSSAEDYSAFFPFARGRIYYVVRTIIDFISKSCGEGHAVDFCDFATGQGVLPDLLRREMPGWNIRCTEGSPALVENLKNAGFAADRCMLGNRQVPPFEVDIGSLTWTLCNCIRPLDVMMEVRDHIKVGGYLALADSSRILVPFKKSLRDLLPSAHPLDIHPYYFSANSICALLRCAGFTPLLVNRYYDSDVLMVIGRKDRELPMDDMLIPADPATQVVDFFRKAHELTGTYDSWKCFSPVHTP
jgi:hypothetical protein